MTPKLYSAVKWGALLGGPLAIFETLGLLLALRGQNSTDLDRLSYLSLILEAVVPLAAGWLAARATGERVHGLVAGVVAGLIVATVNMIGEWVIPPEAWVQFGDLAT